MNGALVTFSGRCSYCKAPYDYDEYKDIQYAFDKLEDGITALKY